MYGYLVFSPHAHARIISVDPSKALLATGVVAYVDHRDIAALGGVNTFGPAKEYDESVFAEREVTVRVRVRVRVRECSQSEK